jgi:hypothetical protein
MKRNIAVLLAAAAMVAAQTPDGAGIGQSMKQNAEALKRYSYKRRTEITVKDRSLGTRVDLVRYVDGKMETASVEAPPPLAQSGRGGLRGKIVEKKIAKKKEEMKEDRERLESLLHSYLSPGSDAMRNMLAKATISRTAPGPDADIKVVATGVAKPSDSFTLVWSVVNHRPVSIEIRAELDGKPVQLAVEYSVLKDGPFYAARTLISVPKKETVIRIDTSDYILSGETK